MARWSVLNNDANIKAMSETLKLSPIASYVLANRNIRSKFNAIKYLNPILNYQNDASCFKDIEKAAKIIIRAKEKNIKTAVYGDYDVDGVMGSTILYKTLKRFGVDVFYYIPHREEEGYGLNMSAVERMHDEGYKLIVTCDNGISAINEIERAKELSMTVIVLDHHEPSFSEDGGVRKDILPCAAAIINPKQKDCDYPFPYLCAAGISYKFAQYFYSVTGMEFTEANEYLILAAIATHCDVVDLIGENRIIAKNGIKYLNDGLCTNIGLNALIKAKNLADKKIGTFDIGFIIGPCINASGRIGHAKNAVRLFTTYNEQEAENLAKSLVELNDERKAMTNSAVELAFDILENPEKTVDERISASKYDKVIVMYLPTMHESIAGIVAGRIKDATNRPTIVLTKSIENDIAKGSARSIEQYHIFEELYKCRDLFERFGGHAMAAGLSCKEENIRALKERLNSACTLEEADFDRILRIEKDISLDEINFSLANELSLFEPFGKENPIPVFCTHGVFTDQIEIVGANKNTLRFIFYIDDAKKIKGICFHKVDQFVELLKKSYSDKICSAFLSGDVKKLNIKMDIAYNIEINEFRGDLSVQLKILDFVF